MKEVRGGKGWSGYFAISGLLPQLLTLTGFRRLLMTVPVIVALIVYVTVQLARFFMYK